MAELVVFWDLVPRQIPCLKQQITRASLHRAVFCFQKQAYKTHIIHIFETTQVGQFNKVTEIIYKKWEKLT